MIVVGSSSKTQQNPKKHVYKYVVVVYVCLAACVVVVYVCLAACVSVGGSMVFYVLDVCVWMLRGYGGGGGVVGGGVCAGRWPKSGRCRWVERARSLSASLSLSLSLSLTISHATRWREPAPGAPVRRVFSSLVARGRVALAVVVPMPSRRERFLWVSLDLPVSTH